MKILFVTKELSKSNMDGNSVCTNRNYEMLISNFGENNVDIVEVKKPSLLRKFTNVLLVQSYGQTDEIINNIENLIKKTKYDFCFLNTSLYGPLVQYLHSRTIKTMVFFHNIEMKYYYDMWNEKKNLLSFLFYRYVCKVESKSCKYADFFIVLNDRDNRELKKNYNRDANLLLPISFRSPEIKSVKMSMDDMPSKYCMFLGSNFFANQQGIDWFIEKVLPSINIHFVIAGSICNYVEKKYGQLKNVTYAGYIEDLDKWYMNASFIVSPIFIGSGMKTKTVEALSYGKSIIGTEEAFVGINADFDQIGAKCNSADSFINAINNYSGLLYNEYSYSWFNDNLSNNKVFKDFYNFVISEIKEVL